MDEQASPGCCRLNAVLKEPDRTPTCPPATPTPSATPRDLQVPNAGRVQLLLRCWRARRAEMISNAKSVLTPLEPGWSC